LRTAGAANTAPVALPEGFEAIAPEPLVVARLDIAALEQPERLVVPVLSIAPLAVPAVDGVFSAEWK
jgi:hypothetical protein